jgi:hypothetical protein
MGIPRQVLLLCLILAGVGIVTTWIGWESIEPYVEDEYEWLQSDNDFAWTAISVGILSVASVVPVLLRLRASGKIALIAYSFSVGALIASLPDPFPPFLSFPESEGNDLWSLIPSAILEPSTLWLYFALALAVGYGAWLIIARNAAWFRNHAARPVTSSARSTWGGPVLTCVTALLVWLLIRNYSPFSIIWLISSFRYDFHFPLSSFDSIVAFAAALAIVIVRLNERADIDERSVQITLGPTGWKLFRLPWKRIRRVEIIRRHGRPSSAVVKSFPFTFALHAKRYQDGEKLVCDLQTIARRYNKPTNGWSVYSNAPWLAVVLVAWGFLVFVYCHWAQTADWMEFSKTNYPPANFEAIASPVRYGLLSALAAACFGTALGSLSAFHHAGVRPALLVLFVGALAYTLPGHTIHWLVWIAIFQIYMAMRGQDPQSVVPHPSLSEWQWGMDLSEYAPIVGAIFYLLAVVLACRRIRESKSEEVVEAK